MTQIGETLAALGELVSEGVVTAIGCSNFSAAELDEADRVARERELPRFVTLQNHYSLLEREIEAEVAPACERLGVSILPFFPLESGLLTGKYKRGEAGPEGTRLAGSSPGTATPSSRSSRRSKGSPPSAGSSRSTSRSPAFSPSPPSPR